MATWVNIKKYGRRCSFVITVLIEYFQAVSLENGHISMIHVKVIAIHENNTKLTCRVCTVTNSLTFTLGKQIACQLEQTRFQNIEKTETRVCLYLTENLNRRLVITTVYFT